MKDYYFIDTHAHLFWDSFKDDIDKVLQRAWNSKVMKIVLPNVDISSIDLLKNTVALAPDRLFPLIGLHPSSVRDNYNEILKKIENELFSGNYYGIGEIGIDLYWEENKHFRDQQVEVFRHQLQLAKKTNLPVVIHTRDSFDITYQIVKEENDISLRGVFHCFTGTKQQAEAIIDLENFYIGIGGVITFKNSKLGERIKEIPLEYMLLETDSPFLTPHPYRGKRNESSYIPIIAERLAQVKNTSVEEVAVITTQNAERLFGI